VIIDLKPYPAMKDSGVPWLGKVPEHWKVERLKSLMCNVVEQTTNRHAGDLYIALEHVESWTGHLRQAISDVVFDSQVKRFRSGDVLFGKLRPYLAKVTRPMNDGVCVGEFLVFRHRNSTVTAPYMEQLLRSKPIIEAINSSTFGAKMPRADWQFIGGMAVTLPSIPEQSAIVLFLDYMDRRIRRYIRAKQKLIKLLEEQKQAIIHSAVTRGLDPSVPLKPSGVEWLGDIPEHWGVLPLRRRWTLTDCKHLTVPFFDHGIPLASVREAQSFDLKLDSCNRTTKEWYNQLIEGGRKPQVGDLIYCRNVSVGASAIVTQDEVFALGQDVCLIRSIKENQRWFNYYLHSKAMADQLALILVGSTFHRINVANIKALLVPVSPRLEQDQISNYLDKELEQIEAAIALCLKQQIILHEYRTRLISDVVTGKLDVRGIDLPAADDADVPEECSDLLDSASVMEDEEPQEIPAEAD
jgi:type I restriction enzyme, S subunit